ncbi:hypothetical protein [Apilactobacillus nanyangensis]|uniref:hypothetical protein n=1 Tax=Apilactobacillus nanyangensis TaxID=2799579 RepID=UPI0019440D0A|nr:hypothetical protein [Apilactobacillus nanyangensis]
MDLIVKKIKSSNFLNNLYTLGFCIQTIVFFLRSTLIGSDHLGRINIIYGRTCTSFLFLSILFILLKIILEDNSSYFYKIFSLFLFCISSYIYLNTNYLEVVCVIMLALGSKGTDYFALAKKFFWIGTFLTALTIFLSLTNVIVNVEVSKSGYTTYALGAVYPTDFAAHIFTLSLSYYVYKMRDSFSYLSIFILCILILITYKVTYAKNDIICMLILLFSITVYKLYFEFNSKFKEKNKIIINAFIDKLHHFYKAVVVSLSSYSFLIISSLSMAFAYTFNNSYFFSKLNDLLTGRIFYSNEAIKLYPLDLLGHKVIQNGFGGVNGLSNATHYFFIDQSVVRMFTMYGLVISSLFIIGYTVKMVRLKSNENSFIIILFAIFSLYCFVDFRVFDPSYNVFLPILFANLSSKHIEY